MTDQLDLSVLARVEPKGTPEDEAPDTRRAAAAPAGKPADEQPRAPRRRTRARATDEESVPGPRSYVRDTTEELLPEYKPGIFVKPLTDAYNTIGMMLLPINQPLGTSFIQNAGECAKALDNAAKVDKRFRKYLMRMLGTSAWMPVLIAHMPIMTTAAATIIPDVRKRLNGVQLPEESPSGETTVNPVSNGYVRQ